MKTLLRYLVIGVVAGVLFLTAGIAIFAAVFDANAYKDDLSGLVREQTGRDLQFHGDVDLTVFPALGMKLGAMSFSNPAEFGAQPMIKVSEASISVDLASLITLAPEIDQLVLRDLEVNLITNKAGKTNWEDLLRPASSTTSSESDTEPSTPAEALVIQASGFDSACRLACFLRNFRAMTSMAISSKLPRLALDFMSIMSASVIFRSFNASSSILACSSRHRGMACW